MVRTISVMLCAMGLAGCAERVVYKTVEVKVPVVERCAVSDEVKAPLTTKMPQFVGPDEGPVCLTEDGAIQLEEHYRELRAKLEAAQEGSK